MIYPISRLAPSSLVSVSVFSVFCGFISLLLLARPCQSADANRDNRQEAID